MTSGVMQGIIKKKEESLLEKEIDNRTAIPSARRDDCYSIRNGNYILNRFISQYISLYNILSAAQKAKTITYFFLWEQDLG